MSFVRYTPAEHKIEQANYIEVEQGDIHVEVLSRGERGALFYAEGLNPCLGITIRGTAQADDGEEPEAFVIFYHCAGLTAGELEKINEGEDEEGTVVNDFCKQAINDMLSRLSDRFDENDVFLSKITIKESSLIRCSQSNTENMQEKLAEELKRIFTSTDEINDLIEEDGSINAEIEFENYNFQSIEELERYENDDREKGEVDAIHVFADSTEDGLRLIYHKGFETVKKLLEAKSEEKNETRNVPPASPSSTSNNQNQSLSQPGQVANTTHIARILSSYQASSPLRSTSPTSPVQTSNNAPVNPRSPSVQTSGVSPSAQEQSEEKVEKENSETPSFRPR